MTRQKDSRWFSQNSNPAGGTELTVDSLENSSDVEAFNLFVMANIKIISILDTVPWTKSVVTTECRTLEICRNEFR